MAIKQGDFIKVPVGTMVWVNGMGTSASKREVVVEVSSTFDAMVMWSNNAKYARAADVISVPKPATSATTKPRKLSVRQQLIKGSQWRFTQATEIIIRAYDAAANFAQTRPGPLQYKIVARYTIPAGAEVTVTGKMHDGYNEDGMLVPVMRDGRAEELPVAQIQNQIEPLAIPTVKVCALRDKTTGKFYGKKNVLWDLEHGEPIIWVSDLAKAKSFDNFGMLQNFLLGFSGYFAKLPGAINALPEWMPTDKVGDVGDTWECVEFDKASKQELGILDVQEPFQRAWRLRPLTIKFGSAVRAVYKRLEKENLLSQFCAIVAFRAEDDNSDGGELKPDDIADVDASLKGAGMARGSYKREKDQRSIAVAVDTVQTAVLLKLRYTGNLAVAALNLATLTEAVE